MRLADVLNSLNGTGGLVGRSSVSVLEVHHAYDDFGYKAQYQPFRAGETLRLFHGFREFSDALSAAKNGLTGRERAARVYSYEMDNNPRGWFVTLNRDIAAEFVGAYGVQVIVEFHARLEDLEAPIWPGNGYTVQGQMAQFFGHGAEGRRKRAQRARDAEQESSAYAAQHGIEHVAQSDKKYLASLLTMTREAQALFVGDLNPHDIIAFHVRPKGALITDPWERISREEFLQRYGEGESKFNRKVFNPADPFDGEIFLTKIAGLIARGDVEKAKVSLSRVWNNIQKLPPKGRGQRFVEMFKDYLWPNQYRGAIAWMKANIK